MPYHVESQNLRLSASAFRPSIELSGLVRPQTGPRPGAQYRRPTPQPRGECRQPSEQTHREVFGHPGPIFTSLPDLIAVRQADHAQLRPKGKPEGLGMSPNQDRHEHGIPSERWLLASSPHFTDNPPTNATHPHAPFLCFNCCAARHTRGRCGFCGILSERRLLRACHRRSPPPMPRLTTPRALEALGPLSLRAPVGNCSGRLLGRWFLLVELFA